MTSCGSSPQVAPNAGTLDTEGGDNEWDPMRKEEHWTGLKAPVRWDKQAPSEEWKQGRSRARSPEGEGGDMRPEETEEDRQAGGQRQSRHGKGRAGCRP